MKNLIRKHSGKQTHFQEQLVQSKDMSISPTILPTPGHVQYPNYLQPPTKLNTKASPADDTLESLLCDPHL